MIDTNFDDNEKDYSDCDNIPNPHHLKIYAATMMDDLPGMCHYNVDWTQHDGHDYQSNMNEARTISCIIIGNEGTGLSQPVRQAVRDGSIQSVYVPMVPHSVESLNAGVCGSVIMFEYLRQVQIKQTATVAMKEKEQEQ